MTRTRRPWTDDEVEKLLNLAQKVPLSRIASEIGRPVHSVRKKAAELRISLRVHQEPKQAIDAADTGKESFS
jgi:hypothetical protein